MSPARRDAAALCPVVALCAAALLAAPLFAQDTTVRAPTPGRVRGRVVVDSGGAPVEGAEVFIASLQRSVRTDTAGRYDIPNLASGSVMVRVRAMGFREESTTIDVRERRVVSLELRLAYDDIVITRPRGAPSGPVTTIEVANPNAPDGSAKMSEFFARQKQGVGRFFGRDDVARWSKKRTAEMLDAVGGLKIENSGLQSFAVNGRVPVSTCTVCRTAVADTLDPAVMISTGTRAACYMDVYLDGSAAYQFGVEPAQPLFDMNAIAPDGIEGVEVYTGAAQVPAKYGSRFRSGCGVILFWSRINPDKKP